MAGGATSNTDGAEMPTQNIFYSLSILAHVVRYPGTLQQRFLSLTSAQDEGKEMVVDALVAILEE